jgi:DNA repair photolyase
MDPPRLFDFPDLPPTTRTIALTVKRGGADALDKARRRADDARYQEVTCRSALNPVKGMPFNWTLNPYRGCTHGCHYCFARRYQTQFELGPDDEFSSLIFVKVNFVTVLRRELDRPSWTRELVAFGTATDPYQPIEGQYKLTRGALEALLAGRTPVGLVTKGPMIVRDADVLAALGSRIGCTVYMSVPTVDEEVWSALEPGTAHPLQRLRAVRQLREAGVNAGVLMAPVVPGFTTQPARLEATVKAIAEHGAAFMGANIMYLKGGTKDHFMRFLAQEYPHMVEGYNRLYAGAYAPSLYITEVRGMIEALQKRYDVARRASRVPPQSDPDGSQSDDVAEQGEFEWASTEETSVSFKQSPPIAATTPERHRLRFGFCRLSPPPRSGCLPSSAG